MLWFARLTWIVLAFTSAPAIDDALASHDAPARVVAALLAWALWGAALFALLAPRPWGFTIVRVATTVAVATALLSAWSTSGSSATLAIGVAVIATFALCSASVAHACADGASYGYERRFPLRAPFALLMGGAPVAALVIAAGLAAGPLLLAASQWVAGAIAVIVGIPIAAYTARALNALSLRWLVIVPAGFVVADPLTLADPVLLPTDRVAGIAEAPAAAPLGSLDLRLGTAFGGLLVHLTESGPFARRSGRNEISAVTTDRVLVTPLRPSWFRKALTERRNTARA